jgi:hypothetical protein
MKQASRLRRIVAGAAARIVGVVTLTAWGLFALALLVGWVQSTRLGIVARRDSFGRTLVDQTTGLFYFDSTQGRLGVGVERSWERNGYGLALSRLLGGPIHSVRWQRQDVPITAFGAAVVGINPPAPTPAGTGPVWTYPPSPQARRDGTGRRAGRGARAAGAAIGIRVRVGVGRDAGALVVMQACGERAVLGGGFLGRRAVPDRAAAVPATAAGAETAGGGVLRAVRVRRARHDQRAVSGVRGGVGTVDDRCGARRRFLRRGRFVQGRDCLVAMSLRGSECVEPAWNARPASAPANRIRAGSRARG